MKTRVVCFCRISAHFTADLFSKPKVKSDSKLGQVVVSTFFFFEVFSAIDMMLSLKMILRYLSLSNLFFFT